MTLQAFETPALVLAVLFFLGCLAYSLWPKRKQIASSVAAMAAPLKPLASATEDDVEAQLSAAFDVIEKFGKKLATKRHALDLAEQFAAEHKAKMAATMGAAPKSPPAP